LLGTEAPAGQALTTPLMVNLARVIYNPRSGELARTLRDPAELCDSALADRVAVESLLFDAFIPAAYRHDSAGRWKAQDAQKWLAFLARHMDGPNLAWWRLPLAIPISTDQSASVLWSLVLAGLGFGLLLELGDRLRFGFGFGFVTGLKLGLGFGFAIGIILLAERNIWKVPSRGIRISAGGVLVGSAVGLIAGVACGLMGTLLTGLPSGLGFGLGIALAVAYMVVLAGKYEDAGMPGNLAASTSPRTMLAHDRQAALFLILTTGLGVGVTTGFIGGLRLGLGLGLAVGLAVGFFVSETQTASPSFILARSWLALHHRLPWSLMDFLADAHRWGVLRQAGAVYQFRHIELQHRLASRYVW
jgi:hypothetical protein